VVAALDHMATADPGALQAFRRLMRLCEQFPSLPGDSRT
jgi:hypothetical protein